MAPFIFEAPKQQSLATATPQADDAADREGEITQTVKTAEAPKKFSAEIDGLRAACEAQLVELS